MSTFWAEPSLQVEAAEKGKEVKEKREESGNMRGEEETTHKFAVNKCCFGHHRAFPQKKGAAVPRCRCVERCPPGRGVRLHTSSGRSAYKCKQCLPFAEEAPCQQRGVHFSRCFNMCKINTHTFLTKGDLEWGQREKITPEEAPYLEVRTPLCRKLHHIWHCSSLLWDGC